MPGNFTAIDFETANKSPGGACAVGLARYRDGKLADTFSTLLKPQVGRFDPLNIQIHGIRPFMVMLSPRFGEVWPVIRTFIGNDPLVAHNAPFDARVLSGELAAAGINWTPPPFYCSLKASRQLWPAFSSHRLGEVASQLGIPTGPQHEAGADAVTAGAIMAAALGHAGVSRLEALAKIVPTRACVSRVAVSCDDGPISLATIARSFDALEGILSGIIIDRAVNPDEVAGLVAWYEDHRHLELRHPYSEVASALREAFADEHLDLDELQDLHRLCRRMREAGSYFAGVTTDIHILWGVLQGITVDKVIRPEEIAGLSEWLKARWHLAGTYPYQDVLQIVESILDDGVVEPEEVVYLETVINGLLGEKRSTKPAATQLVPSLPDAVSIPGEPWDHAPIVISGSVFVLTGESVRAPRTEIAARICEAGGTVASGISKRVSYLVVGGAGSAAWAFSSYGTKIEKALELQHTGCCLRIVKEELLWPALGL